MKMISQLSHVMTLANSIIGVSVLAMPFCFKQCGIVLATLVLLLSSVLSRLACHFLVKSAVMCRRRNFELLAFHAFGHMGKFLVELFIIGFLVGTCIAFFVVMGDLGPQIIGKIIDKNPDDIRTSLLITTSVFIVLPLGLLRNIDSLSTVCTATIVFYLCLVLKVIAESTQHIFAGDWYEHVYYWKPSGILQCLPIFSMALFCQTQLFEIYDTIPNVSLEKMNEVVRGALNICTIVYLCVGFFGYVAFCTQPFTGNILMSFEPSLSSEMIKMGFVFSVAFSFPLVIFPCRASLNSLLFRRVYTHEPSINYLPEARFRCLTIVIVAISLITGILIPNIEFVLGLVGSTIGVMICLIFPAVFFISISSKNTNERLLAQSILFIGIWIMVLGTYANLYAMEESTNLKNFATTSKPLSQMNNIPLNLNKDDIRIIANIPNSPEILKNVKEQLNEPADLKILDNTLNVNAKDVRQEPPIPVERIVITEMPVPETQRPIENIAATFSPEIKKIVDKIKVMDKDLNKDIKVREKADMKEEEPIILKAEEKISIIEEKERSANMQKNDNLINSDAIKKEESELAADGEAANIIAAERHEELRKTLEKHKLEQLQMIQEQKELLKDIKEHKQEFEREKHRMEKNVKESKNIEKLKNTNLEYISKDTNSVVNLKDSERKDIGKTIETQDKKNVLTDNEILDKPVSNFNIIEKDSPEKTRMLDNKEENKVQENFSKQKDQIDNQNMGKNTIKKFSPTKETNNAEVLTNSVIDLEKVKGLQVKLVNSEELMKGPILNALTKRTLQKSVPSDTVDKQNDVYQDVHEKDVFQNHNSNALVKNEDSKVRDQYLLPIALKMRNQTKTDDASIQLMNKSQDDIQAIRREILENHEREKRDVNTEVAEIHAKITTEVLLRETNLANVDVAKDIGNENCLKSNKDVQQGILEEESHQTVFKLGATEASLIKTNVYLSEQEFAHSVSVDPNIDIRSEYIKIKQRDLKAVKAFRSTGV